MATEGFPRVDPNSGIPELVRSLADDSKRLAGDEVRLAKLELHESVHAGAMGVTRLAISLAFGIVAAVALTVLLVTVISTALDHNYWAGALIVGAIEIVVGLIVLRRGVNAVRSPTYALQASRESLKDTATWARNVARR